MTQKTPQKTSTKKTDSLQKEFPRQIREQLLAMKTDVTAQLREKIEKLGTILADPRFDDGITIVERYKFGLSPLTQDLDEHSLLGYIAHQQANDPRFTTIFQELLEWMKKLPSPKKKR